MKANKLVEVDGLSIFYREAGSRDKETILLLHGFPSSSYMYSGLIEQLAEEYHLVAPDYPGFGLSAAPNTTEFEYTFDNVSQVMEKFVDALNLDSYYLMVQDYGGPIGFRLAVNRPAKVKGFIIQNANAYKQGFGEWAMKIGGFQKANDLEGLTTFKDHLLTLEGLKEQHIVGAKNPDSVDPSYYLMDEAFLNRPGAKEIQSAMFFNYGSNFPKYPEWQAYFKKQQPKTLIVWGENDKFFTRAGGEAFSNDLNDVESHYFNGSHFMLDEYATEVAGLIRGFIK